VNDETVGVIYFYFDYKDRLNQSKEKVSATLLKQLACQLGEIPPELEAMYDKSMRRGLPGFETLIATFLKCVKNSIITSTFVLLDAFDECETSLQNHILYIIRNFSASGIKILCTTRTQGRSLLEAQSPGAVTVQISAQEGDIRLYSTSKPEMKRLHHDLQVKIIKTITTASAGMYPFGILGAH